MPQIFAEKTFRTEKEEQSGVVEEKKVKENNKAIRLYLLVQLLKIKKKATNIRNKTLKKSTKYRCKILKKSMFYSITYSYR